MRREEKWQAERKALAFVALALELGILADAKP